VAVSIVNKALTGIGHFFLLQLIMCRTQPWYARYRRLSEVRMTKHR
jgi:hypothetical protein